MGDKFYTKADVARLCAKQLRRAVPLDEMTIVEPSAGNGAFSSQFQGCVAVDIEPNAPNIIQADFLTMDRNTLNLPDPKSVVIVGNPPFGAGRRYGYKEAHKFLAHSMTLADTVAFILPAAFSGPYQQSTVNPFFHLVHEIPLPFDSFTPHVNIHCIFQVWQRRETQRMNNLTERDEQAAASGVFVPQEEACCAIVRVGYHAGLVKRMTDLLSPQSHFFLSSRLEAEIGRQLLQPTGKHRYVTKIQVFEALIEHRIVKL